MDNASDVNEKFPPHRLTFTVACLIGEFITLLESKTGATATYDTDKFSTSAA